MKHQEMDNRFILLKNKIIKKKLTSSQQKNLNCSFPYYRSSGCRDSVLVKDIGITCELLKVPNVCENPERSFDMKQDNTKHIRSDDSTEYLSITRRISSYTREMLNNLTMKISRKNIASHKKLNNRKIPIATEYSDENGQPGLKLRFENTDKNNHHQKSEHLAMNSLDKSSEKNSNEKLEIILPPVIKNRNDTTKLSTFSMDSYLNIENKSSNGGVVARKSHKHLGFHNNQKTHPSSVHLNDCWSGINLNASTFRKNKHKRKL